MNIAKAASMRPGAVNASLTLRRVACAITGTVIGLAQGLGLYLVGSNLPNIQGSLGATAAEANWLTTAYFATALSSTLLLVKIRLHIGLGRFAIAGLSCFVAASVLHLATNSLPSAIFARALLGIVAPAMSTLAVLYLVEAFPPRLAVAGLLLGFCALQLGLPLSRVVATDLLAYRHWHGLFLLDTALAVVSLSAILLVRLTPAPIVKSLRLGDLVAFPLYAIGLALLSVAVTQGRTYWWTDTWWIGACLVASIACIALYVLVDLTRAEPMLDLRWLASPYMVRFVVSILLFRIVLSEQSIGIVGLMTILGQNNEQMETLFGLATLGTLGGFALSILIAFKGGTRWLAMIAVALVVAAALKDSTSTSLIRPEQLYLSQTLLATGLAIFFSAAVLLGFGPVLADGSKQLISFLAAFSAAQYLGSLLGSAWVTTYVARRQHYHYDALVQYLRIGDPQAAARIRQLSGSVARFVTDPVTDASQGVVLLYQQVTRESFVLAYDDVFLGIALIGSGLFVFLSLLAWSGRRNEAALRKAARPSAT